MGKNNQSKDITQQAQQRYQTTTTPTPTENEFVPFSQQMNNNYQTAVARNTEDYGNIMGAYQKFRENLGSPTKFSFQNVSAPRPAELGESYGILREALPGYREFASTGGYSPTDIQELRARGVSPIRSAYGNTMMQLDRARALGGASGTPNYIAALSRAQRELPEQLASATTDVNAKLAEDIRQGRLAGLAGIRGVGGDMGQLSSAEAGRQLQANLANAENDLRAQQLTEGSRQSMFGNQLASIGGQASLYGTTPGMSSMFGNQALNSYQLRSGMENARNQFGLGLIDAQLQGNAQRGQPWWQQALGVAGTVAPFFM